MYFFKTNDKNYFNNRILFVPSSSVLNDKTGYFVYLLEKKENNYIVKKTKY